MRQPACEKAVEPLAGFCRAYLEAQANGRMAPASRIVPILFTGHAALFDLFHADSMRPSGRPPAPRLLRPASACAGTKTPLADPAPKWLPLLDAAHSPIDGARLAPFV